MSHYADSSFLVSCYLADANTQRAQTQLSKTGSPFVLTGLQSLEVRNACRLGVFRGFFSSTQAEAAWANFQTDIRVGRLVWTEVKWPVVFRAATLLSEKHSSITGARSLDILHVATALSLGADKLLTFDARQRALAARAGLSTVP